MCGIAGIAEYGGISAEDRIGLDAMLERLIHRGPDDEGHYITSDVALGQRRLSIIDLETGRQPLCNEDGTIQAIANAEIYNFLELREDLMARGHQFRTTSDCECLAHLYEDEGDRCLDHINGMYAIAIWDEPRRRLLLARDRLGVKPLYYSLHDGRLVFASELKAVLAAPGVRTEVDPTALIDYFTYGFIPSPKTIYKNIHKLPPGHLLVFQNGGARTRPYWDLKHQDWHELPAEETAAEVWCQLKRATRPRLIADVPVGAFLSGGLDSTAVVAAMSKLTRERVLTMTCGFETRSFDERNKARETASVLGTQHHDGMVEPDADEMVETLAWHFDEPFADACAIPMYYLSQFARQFVKVVLSGDGGDETMAGYRRYRFDQYEESARRWIPRPIRRGILGRLGSTYPEWPWMPRPLRAGATLRNLAVDSATAHGLSIATLSPREVRSMLNPDLANQTLNYDPLNHVRRLYHACDAPSHLSKCQYVDIRLGLADGILTKVDRASMAHGLEVRSPMLDYRFAEFAWRIPPKHRIRGRHGKMPLRRAVAREVRPDIANRTKTGFDVPLDAWFKGPLRERFQEILFQRNSTLQSWIAPEAIWRLWADHIEDRARCGATLWKLTMLEAWCKREADGWKLGTYHRRNQPLAKTLVSRA